jgi:solute carrier family 35
MMLAGALVAASDDITFNWFGYVFLSVNNLCTAAQGVVIKQKLVNKVGQSFLLGRY